MAEEFPIPIHYGRSIRTALHSQLFRTPPYPTLANQSFVNQTIIVTGSNVGIGLEAARHFYRLNCAKLILAVRTVSKGEVAKEDIVQSVEHRSDANTIEIWPLDLCSTESVLKFVERVEALPRVDVIVENAGMHNRTWARAEGFEETIQVNVLSTLLIALLALPKLRETKTKFPDSVPHLVIVSSEAHRFSHFKEINAPDIYAKLNEQSTFSVERYGTSKLIEVLFIRELVSRFSDKQSSTPPVIIDMINPGFTHSQLHRNQARSAQIFASVMLSLIGRTTEVGSRTLVYGACAGPTSHGEFMSDGLNQDVESWIYEDMGKKAQKKVFEQTMKVLETRSPGIGKAVGL